MFVHLEAIASPALKEWMQAHSALLAFWEKNMRPEVRRGHPTDWIFVPVNRLRYAWILGINVPWTLMGVNDVMGRGVDVPGKSADRTKSLKLAKALLDAAEGMEGQRAQRVRRAKAATKGQALSDLSVEALLHLRRFLLDSYATHHPQQWTLLNYPPLPLLEVRYEDPQNANTRLLRQQDAIYRWSSKTGAFRKLQREEKTQDVPVPHEDPETTAFYARSDDAVLADLREMPKSVLRTAMWDWARLGPKSAAFLEAVL